MGGGPDYPNIETVSHGSIIEVLPLATSQQQTYKVLFKKDQVYLHPSTQQKDNVKGHVCILSRPQAWNAAAEEILLAWFPASVDLDRDDLNADQLKHAKYAFVASLTQIYSLVIYPPTITSWNGSLTIAMFGGNTMPTLYFHDDQSASSMFNRDTASTRPFIPLWGGEMLLKRIKDHAQIIKSTLEPSLYLVNPSRTDIEVHSTPLFEDLPEQSSSSSSDEPVPRHLLPQKKRTSILHQSLTSRAAKRTEDNAQMDNLTFNVLNTLGRFTRTARSAAKEFAKPILRHDLAKPILPHLPPPVANLAAAESAEFTTSLENAGVRDFNQAAVFLAKWARQVAEEGERLRRMEVGASADGEEASALGAFDLLASTYEISRPRTSRAVGQPIVVSEWNAWFSPEPEGQLLLSEEEAKRRIFQRGLDAGVRAEAWPFLLKVFPWKSTAAERRSIAAQKQAQFQSYRSTWADHPEVTSTEEFIEERHRIEIDCRRTDRKSPLFDAPPDQEDLQNVSPEMEQRADYSGGQPPSNVHVRRLQEILLTYNAYEKELGYVQGMSDLASPIYICMNGDASLTFWCFVAFMERLKGNFLRDQSGMKTQLSNLQQLIAIMDPTLYAFLEKTDSMNLFFCFRWILIFFKREFPLEDVLKIWENLLTDVYGQHFHLFIALAILEAHRTIIMRYLQSFDEVLKYVNELSMTMEAEPFLCQAEILHLTLKEIVEREDRKRAYMDDLQGSVSDQALRNRKNTKEEPVRHDTSSKIAIDSSVRAMLM